MRPWSIEECEAYAKQLRDKTRASTADHAAQAIEYLLGLVRREWVGLTWEEIDECFKITPDQYLSAHIYKRIFTKLKEKNT